ncbi:beta strand repeat-containing protein [Methylibium petroleiphilum]|uniref:beta strand repeat-containing protein n=1 Tax=Methylibium petroleiphilum TaxID=105560 RepID=UPI00130530C3|nr:choice-of-anchor D domain-containing protein [Methylibium petroleiphilum]
MLALVSLALAAQPVLAAPRYMIKVPVVGITSQPAGDLSVAPSPANFAGQVAVGTAAAPLKLTVTNNGFSSIGNLSVSMPQGAPDFSQSTDCPAALPGRSTCTITLGFTPSTDGARTGSVAVSSTAANGLQLVSVSGSGSVPSVTVAPAAFPATQVGDSSVAAVTVSNTGTSALGLSRGTPTSPFSVSGGTCGSTLAAGASCLYQVTFAPTSSGSATSPFAVNFSVGSYSFSRTATLSATAQDAAASLTAPLFGAVAAGATKDISATLRNDGVGAITVGTASVSGSGFNLTSNSCSGSLAVGATCSIGVRLTGSGTNAHSGTLSVATQAGTKTAALSGQSEQAVLSFNPANYAFGSVQVASTGTQAFTLRNIGNIATGALSFNAPAGYSVSAPSCATGIPAGGNCAVSVTFAPSAAQAYSGNVGVTGSASSATLAVSGSGQDASATLSAVAFGNVPAGTSAQADATLTNTGVGPLTLSAPSASGAGFSVATGGSCGATLAAGASCTIKVQLTASGTSAHAGSLSVATTEAGTKTASLSGQSQQASLAVSPSTEAFGNVMVGQTPTSAAHTVTNSGNIPATGIAITAPQGYQIVAGSPACSSSLAAGASCKFSIQFAPGAAQAYTGNVTVASDNAGSPTVAVSGTGLLKSTATLTSPATVLLADWYQTGTITGGFTYRNDGNTPMTLASPALASPLSVSANTCTSVAAGSSCTITVALTRNANNGGTSSQSFIASGADVAPAQATVNWSIYSAIPNWASTSLSFGSIQVGQSSTKSVTLTNSGSVAYNWATNNTLANAPAGFSFDFSACANVTPGGSCAVNVTFSPSAAQAYGGSNIYLTAASIIGNTLTLSGSGAAQSASITDVAFGNQAAGATPTLTSTLTNTGVGPLSVTVPAAGSVTGTAFSFVSTNCGSSLAVGGSCTTTVRYTASGTAAASGSLTIATGAGSKVAALSGQSQQAIVSVSPTSRAFGNVQVGQTSTSAAHTVSNTGNIAATSLSISAPTGYSITGNTCSTSLAAGGSCSFTITFTSGAAQDYSGNVIVSTANGGSPTVAVSGTGQAPSASITDIAFGNQAAGATPTLTSTLTNTGVGSISVTAPSAGSVTGTGFSFVSTNCGSSLAVGGSCTTTVRYTASGTAAASGSLTIATGAGNKVAALSGQSQQAIVGVSATSRAFGSVQVGQSSTSAAHTVSNTGNIAATSLSISAPTGYSITGNTCSTSLAAGGSCTFTITFSPSAAQAYNGNVSVATANGGSPTVAVTGAGAAQAATITDIAFGNQAAGATPTLTSTLTNTGVGPLSVTVPTAGSVTGTGFSFVSTTCGTSLAAGANCTTTVRYTASGTAAASGSLTIATGAGNQVSDLSGQSQQAILSLTSSLAFGTIQVNDTKDLVATLNNTGNIAATTTARSIAGTGFAINATTCSTSLAAGASCTITVRYSAPSAASHSGTLTVTSANAATDTSSLSGTGRAASATLSAPAHGTMAAGSTKDVTAILSNTGIAPMSVTVPTAGSVSGSGFSFVSTTCSTSLAAGADCSIVVRLTYSGTTAHSGTLSVGTEAGTKTASLSGQSQAAVVGFSGSSVAFGNVTVGNTVVSATQTVTNSGNVAATSLAITAPTFAPNYPYFIGANTCGSSLAAGASCTFTISFTPQAAQAFNGNVTLTSANGGSDALAVTGTGTQSLQLEVQTLAVTGKEAQCGATSAWYNHAFTGDVGGQSWNCTPQTWNLRLTNKTASTMTIGSFTKTSASWTIASNSCGTTLAAGASCVVAIKSPTYTSSNSSSTYVRWTTVGIDKYVYIY